MNMLALLFATVASTVTVSPAVLNELAGSYQISPAHVIDIGQMDEINGDLVFLDQKTLREGRLRPVSATEFVSGPTLGQDEPIAIRAQFIRDPKGHVTGLRWTGEGRTRVLARRVAPRRDEQVVVRNGEVELHGVLHLPATKGPHPAVIFAHGSGDSKRNVAFWNMFFVRMGFAVLSMNKRGVAPSTGSWHQADMNDIAGDWLAGLEMLKKRSDIDPKRIGVHGSSQGGWTAPLMAARSSDVAFIIVRAGSGTNVRDTMIHEIEWTVREAKFSEAEATAAGVAAGAIFDAEARGAGWEEFEAIVTPLRTKPWAEHVWPMTMSKERWGRHWAVKNLPFDSSETLKQVKVPVLWFLGEHDHNVPSELSATKLRAALRTNPDATVITLKDTGHSFIQSKTGNNNEVMSGSRLVPGYFDVMEKWLKKRFRART